MRGGEKRLLTPSAQQLGDTSHPLRLVSAAASHPVSSGLSSTNTHSLYFLSPSPLFPPAELHTGTCTSRVRHISLVELISTVCLMELNKEPPPLFFTLDQRQEKPPELYERGSNVESSESHVRVRLPGRTQEQQMLSTSTE